MPKSNSEKKLAKDSKKNPRTFHKYINRKKSNKSSTESEWCLPRWRPRYFKKFEWFFSCVFTAEDLLNIPYLSPIKGDILNLENMQLENLKFQPNWKKLKPFSAQVSSRLLIQVADTICVPKAIILEEYMAECEVPSDWKKANLTPIFKERSKFQCFH